MYTYLWAIPPPVTRSLTLDFPRGELPHGPHQNLARFLADLLQRCLRERQDSNPAGQTEATGTQIPRASRVPRRSTLGKPTGDLWLSRSQETAQGPSREAVLSASRTDDQSLPLHQRGTSLPRHRASRRDQGPPPSLQTLQQAQDPEAEGALASAPSLAEGRALESLARGPGCGSGVTPCVPEHMSLRTRWSAHACMCACLKGGGKFSLQV